MDAQTRNRPVRVLIVDDEPDILATLSLRIRKEGTFIVQTARDGAHALDEVRTFRPDVVLLDLVMPEVDGWEVCRRLRADDATKNLPVIVMTAHPAAILDARAQKEGIHRVLFKPFDPAYLVGMLRRALSTAV